MISLENSGANKRNNEPNPYGIEINEQTERIKYLVLKRCEVSELKGLYGVACFLDLAELVECFPQ